jgi:hypothetical protein
MKQGQSGKITRRFHQPRPWLPYLLTNPDVGMNAGAAPPGETRVSDVTNFPADVIREVQ